MTNNEIDTEESLKTARALLEEGRLDYAMKILREHWLENP